MAVRTWIYSFLGVAMFVVAALTAFDQLFVEYGDDSAYILGKATPIVVWVLTLGVLSAVTDFFRWLYRSRRIVDSITWVATTAVILSFSGGWLIARDWSLEWLVENDIEISFGRDEYLQVVVALWSACATALALWLSLRTKARIDRRTASNASQL